MSITIGIPFFNAEAYLGDAIRSVFAQTYQDWELILVDDGSTDRSLEIALSINDPRVRVLSDGCNRKLPFRLNQVTSEAQYDLIGRMDADDLISPTRFEKQVAILNAHPEIDLVTTGVCSITNDNRPVGIRCGFPDDSITGRKLLQGQCAIVHAAILGRKSWFMRNRYDETAMLTEDYELWLRAFSHNDFRLHIQNEPLYYYREENNATAEKLLTAYRNQVELIKKYGYLGFNRFELGSIIAKFRCKSIVVRLLDLLNKTDVLLKKRNTPIADDSLLQHFNQEIDQILQTRLPQ
ncbi:MAG: glycosyltransferase [Geobacteraceae bacterium]|nr:glycosyltransferase [Geobacteraceae bacterium]